MKISTTMLRSPKMYKTTNSLDLVSLGKTASGAFNLRKRIVV